MNSITIAGQLGKDAEIRYSNDGKAITSFSVADQQYGDKGPIWWKCTIFGERGPKLDQYLKKGQAVTISGTITESKYINKQGAEVTSLDIRVNDVALQGGRRNEEPVENNGLTRRETENSMSVRGLYDPSRKPSQDAAKSRDTAPRSNSGGFEDMDDDIPFANPLRGARCLVM